MVLIMDGKEWYKQQLQTTEWKAKRAEVYARDGYACVDCGEDAVTIDCHHLHYVKGKPPWDYPTGDLVTVCRDCHEERHKVSIMKFASHADAEMWYAISALEAAMLEEHLANIDNRIKWLEDRGATFDSENRYWGFVDRKGKSRFFDEDGNPL